MKLARYEWEDCFFNSSISNYLSYDGIENIKLKQVSIKYTTPVVRNIDYSKLLAFGYVFGHKNKKFLQTEENKDKNPLKKATKKMISSRQFVSNKREIDIISYVVLVFLYAYLRKRNIAQNQTVTENTFNITLKEINSILKVAHSYNILDADPSVSISFHNRVPNKALVNYYKKT